MMRQSGELRTQSQARLNKLVQRLGELSREEWDALFVRCPRNVQRAFMVYVVDLWARSGVDCGGDNG